MNPLQIIQLKHTVMSSRLHLLVYFPWLYLLENSKLHSFFFVLRDVWQRLCFLFALFLNLVYVITSKTVTSDEIVFSLFCLYILIYKKYNYFHEIWLIVNKLVKQWQFRKFDNSTLWMKKKSNKPTNHRLCVWKWTESFALAEIYSSPFSSHGWTCDKDYNSVACALRATHHHMW